MTNRVKRLPGITFRRATVGDIDSMIKVNQNDGFPHAYPLPRKRLENLFERGEIFIVAIFGDKVVGFGSIDCEIRARIHFLSVEKIYSGNGIGTQLMKRLLEVAIKKHYKRAHSIVEAKSSKELFLKKYGYKKVGYYKGRYGLGKDASFWEISLE